MSFPPLLARVGFRRGAVWLPLFLLWALLLVLLLPALVLLLIALVLPPRWRLLPLARGVWAVLCASRGTRIEIAARRTRLSIALV